MTKPHSPPQALLFPKQSKINKQTKNKEKELTENKVPNFSTLKIYGEDYSECYWKALEGQSHCQA